MNEALPSTIKELAQRDRIAFKKHSALRMYERNIRAHQVTQILINGDIIEEYRKDRPYLSCLVGGYVENQKPLHVVVAVDKEGEMLWIITAYTPDKAEWEEGFKRRKKK